MMNGLLRRELKEPIALLVSDANACEYCVSAHRAALQDFGMTRDMIQRLIREWEGSGFAPKELSLMQFAVRSTRKPGELRDGDLALLREIGWSDAEIIEAQGVMELYTGINKFLDFLAVDVDS